MRRGEQVQAKARWESGQGGGRGGLRRLFCGGPHEPAGGNCHGHRASSAVMHTRAHAALRTPTAATRYPATCLVPTLLRTYDTATLSRHAPQTIMAALAKFGCAGAFTIASIFTSELFPTLVRSAVLGAENEAARVGGIAAPFIVLLVSQPVHP